MTQAVTIEVSPGELIDKITILKIKSVEIADPAKQINIQTELTLLNAARQKAFGDGNDRLSALTEALQAVNQSLWHIEDDIRDCEAAGDFGPRFIELARSVYRRNDERARLKREINTLLGSQLVEEKSYRDY